MKTSVAKNMRRIFLVIVFFCLASTKTKADTIEFVRDYLGLQITNFVFGSALTNFPEAREKTLYTSPDMQTGESAFEKGAEWYLTKYSDLYEKKYPGAKLWLGFQKGRLVGIHVWSGFGFAGNKETSRKDFLNFLNKFSKEFQRLSGNSRILQDDHLRIRYEPLCSPAEIFAAGIRITPPSKQ
jgi:hypothetical protein